MRLLPRLLSVALFALILPACGLRSGSVTATRPAMAALDVEPDDVNIRIVDVGPGLRAVITVPGGASMVYDAGHWNGEHCLKAVRELITGDAIDLLVISHSDADHLGDGARIFNEKRVRHTILAGEPRTTASVPLGEAVVTLVAGWPRWDGPGPTPSERLNAISIVVHLEYRGRSILFTGNTVGRRLDDDDDACKDAEQVMVERHGAGQVLLKSDVLIASHHGANNDSATDPRRAVCRERDMPPSYRGQRAVPAWDYWILISSSGDAVPGPQLLTPRTRT